MPPDDYAGVGLLVDGAQIIAGPGTVGPAGGGGEAFAGAGALEGAGQVVGVAGTSGLPATLVADRSDAELLVVSLLRAAGLFVPAPPPPEPDDPVDPDPDPDAPVVAGVATAAVRAVRIVTDLPADLEGQLPVVQVTEIPGGAQVQPAFDSAVVEYDAYAEDRVGAKVLAANVRRRLLAAAGFMTADRGMWVSRVVEVSRPALLPYDDASDIRRFGGSVRMFIRYIYID